jgi:hypothetical protein
MDEESKMNFKALCPILVVVVLLLLTVGGAVSCSPAFPEALQDKILVDESGNYRLMAVLHFTPHATPSDNFPIMPVPRPSATWDCDDDALYMFDYFRKTWCASEGRKISIVAVIGNLDIENEDVLKFESDHVWVILSMDGEYWIAYDWGEPCFDSQHYEGCIITYEELLQAVEWDKQ